MTTYALIQNEAIQQIGPLPKIWNDGTRYWDLRDPSQVDLTALGWLEVVQVARPADTATTTFDRSVTLVDGSPTETWTERDKTQAELDSDVTEANRSSIETKSRSAIQGNKDYLALSSPSNADRNAQLEALTRQSTALIRLVLGELAEDDVQV